jgi:carbon-monoxide dehydrogenase large subunit
MLSAVLLRSAHAKINSINVDAAREAPEVAAVLTGEDLKDKVGSLPCVAQAEHIPFHPVLAQGRVRYVDEPVMAVVATDPYSAQDALDIVEIDYEPLDAVVDPEQALTSGAPLIHEQSGNNLVVRVEVPNPAVDDAIRNADRTIRFRLVNQRLAPVPMEPRGVVAQWHAASKRFSARRPEARAPEGYPWRQPIPKQLPLRFRAPLIRHGDESGCPGRYRDATLADKSSEHSASRFRPRDRSQ